jgi:hypothetical protein
LSASTEHGKSDKALSALPINSLEKQFLVGLDA